MALLIIGEKKLVQLAHHALDLVPHGGLFPAFDLGFGIRLLPLDFLLQLCDVSAGSGWNALARDEEYAVKFINEFQDRLMFGTDICRPDTATPLVDFMLKLRDEKKISETVFQKVARENIIRILDL